MFSIVVSLLFEVLALGFLKGIHFSQLLMLFYFLIICSIDAFYGLSFMSFIVSSLDFGLSKTSLFLLTFVFWSG